MCKSYNHSTLQNTIYSIDKILPLNVDGLIKDLNKKTRHMTMLCIDRSFYHN